MAKRSDFAQKLLDDLRLRKERMAASQSSNQSTTISVDAYAYAKHMYKGSRDLNPHKRGSNKGLQPFNAARSGGRSVSVQDASQQVVLYGKGHKPEKIDLSRGLAFALENGGNLNKINSLGQTSILGVLHQIVGKNMDFTRLERRNSMDIYHPSTNSVLTFSHEHITDISKGAIKLNQILRACSHGLNFGTYSAEIGRELLQGAMDLEESLRMLVNLQEASEGTITPPRRSRITLLEDEEEDNDVINESGKKQLSRPCFSFDKASKTALKIQEIAKSDIKQKLVALDYQKKTTNFNTVSHKRSLSYSPDIKTLDALSEKKTDISSSQSRPEKGRIPNVVAKLMGLELPENAETKNTVHEKPSSKKKTENIIAAKAARRSNKGTEQNANKIGNVAPKTGKPRLTQDNGVSPDQKTAVDLQAGKKVATHSVILDMVMHHGKGFRKDLEIPRQPDHSRQTIIKEDHGHGKNDSSNQNDAGSKKELREDEWKLNIANHQEQRARKMGETKEGFLKVGPKLVAPELHKRPDTPVILQEREGLEGKMLHTDKRSVNKFLSGYHPKPRNSDGFRHSYMSLKPEFQEGKHQAEERVQQNTRPKPPMRTQRGGEAVSKIQRQQPTINKATETIENAEGTVDLVQPERYSLGRHKRNLLADKSSINVNINLKDSFNRVPNQNLSPEVPIRKLGQIKPDFEQAAEVRQIHLAPIQKENYTKNYVRKIPRHVEVMAKRNGTVGNFTKPLKQKVQEKGKSYSETGSEKTSMSQAAEVCITKSSNSTTGLQTINAESLQKGLEEIGPLNISLEKCHSKTENLTPKDCTEDGVTTVPIHNHQGAAHSLGGGEHLESSKIASNPLHGSDGGEDAYPLQLHDQKRLKPRRNECLTESERQIKHILIKNQLFLNTAEALFKLNIPFDILHASGQDIQDEESKLVLDCGYELTRRKGKMQELRIHNSMKISIFSMKVKSLDDLVKQIHKDFGKLKLYGRGRRNSECDVEDYLPRMLDEDLQTRDPDINCMWDLGWNEDMFALIDKDDVIRDVEKYMLNNLIDEALRDLFLLVK